MSTRQERVRDAMRRLADTFRSFAADYEREGQFEKAKRHREEAEWYAEHAELQTGMTIPQEAQK